MGVNESRAALAQNVTDAVSEAKLIAFDASGQAAVWYGSDIIHIYDAARRWQKVSTVFSTELAHVTDRDSEKAYDYAAERMLQEGFHAVR